VAVAAAVALAHDGAGRRGGPFRRRDDLLEARIMAREQFFLIFGIADRQISGPASA